MTQLTHSHSKSHLRLKAFAGSVLSTTRNDREVKRLLFHSSALSSCFVCEAAEE
jgi:hypothetical protein